MSRHKLLERKMAFRKPKKFFYVATEGDKTEPHYLSMFKPHREAGIQIKVLPSRDKSSPEEVLTRLIVHLKQNWRNGDEAWLLIDRDAWPEQTINTVCREAKKKNYFVAVSNPCFELWLYLHLKDNRLFSTRQDCQKELQKIFFGYSKADFDLSLLRPRVTDAIRRAQSLDENLSDPWPQKQGTRVYQLIQKLHPTD